MWELVENRRWSVGGGWNNWRLRLRGRLFRLLSLGAASLIPVLFDMYLYLYLELVSIHYGIYITVSYRTFKASKATKLEVDEATRRG